MILCEWCKLKIFIEIMGEQLNYRRSLERRKFWHEPCIERMINEENIKNGVYKYEN